MKLNWNENEWVRHTERVSQYPKEQKGNSNEQYLFANVEKKRFINDGKKIIHKINKERLQQFEIILKNNNKIPHFYPSQSKVIIIISTNQSRAIKINYNYTRLYLYLYYIFFTQLCVPIRYIQQQQCKPRIIINIITIIHILPRSVCHNHFNITGIHKLTHSHMFYPITLTARINSIQKSVE